MTQERSDHKQGLAVDPAAVGDDPIELLTTTDAQVWAKQFMRTLEKVGRANVDEGMMLAWFANLIETGRNAGRREVCPHAADRVIVVADDLRICGVCGAEVVQPEPTREDMLGAQFKAGHDEGRK